MNVQVGDIIKLENNQFVTVIHFTDLDLDYIKCDVTLNCISLLKDLGSDVN